MAKKVKQNQIVKEYEFSDVDDVSIMFGASSEIAVRSVGGGKVIIPVDRTSKFVSVETALRFETSDGEYDSLVVNSTLYEFSTVHSLLPTKAKGRSSVVVREKKFPDGGIFFTVEITYNL